MKASEFVAQTQALIAEHGDLPILGLFPQPDGPVSVWKKPVVFPSVFLAGEQSPQYIAILAE